MEVKTYENFPMRIVILSIIVTLTVYALGAYILLGFGLGFALVYLIYCLWVEMRIFKMSCVHCYYYGKFCGLGRGKVCSFFYKKGDAKKFLEKEIRWKDLIPDFMVTILPLIGGIILLLGDFDWSMLGILILLLILSFGGSAVIRGSFACKYCKQKEIGCPAEKLFGKEK